jgi:shikimate dehydrogenase
MGSWVRTLAQEVRPLVNALAWDDRHAALEGAAMLVNATSQSMATQPALALTLDGAGFGHHLHSAGNAH